MRLSSAIKIADLRRLARRRLPPVVFDYIDGGAEDEITLRANEHAFAEVTFRPRQCVDTPSVDLATTVLGTTFELPFLLAPVGFCRMVYPRGESVAAREANAAGTAYILSTFSGTRLEDVSPDRNGLVPLHGTDDLLPQLHEHSKLDPAGGPLPSVVFPFPLAEPMIATLFTTRCTTTPSRPPPRP